MPVPIPRHARIVHTSPESKRHKTEPQAAPIPYVKEKGEVEAIVELFRKYHAELDVEKCRRRREYMETIDHGILRE